MMINGVWEVPTMVDLAKQNKLFNWGAIELPVLFNHACTYEDSHTFAIPNNVGKTVDPAKHADVLEVIKWMEAHALFWATAGHIPASSAVLRGQWSGTDRRPGCPARDPYGGDAPPAARR